MKKMLIVANVAKEHILKFHLPTIKMMKENGWIVHVACSGTEKIPFCDKQWIMPYKRNPFSIRTLLGIRDLKKIITNEKYDIVHCHTPTGGIVARLAASSARKDGLKVIYTSHGYHFYKGAPLLNWILFLPIEWLLSFLTDIIITINQEDYEITKKFHNKSLLVEKINGIGCMLDKFYISNLQEVKSKYRNILKIPSDALVLIYVAELIPNKNQKFLIKMFDILNHQNDNVYLLLVGPDHINGKYEKVSKKLHLHNKVIFLGWRDDIAELLACSDICVASSIREGFGLNLIEAMAVGIPIIATKNRGHSEIIKNGYNGYLIEQGDYNRMKDLVIKLVKNEKLKKQIIFNAKKDLSQYEYKSILNELKMIYDKIIFEKEFIISGIKNSRVRD